jgi:hypothetical protein
MLAARRDFLISINRAQTMAQPSARQVLMPVKHL